MLPSLGKTFRPCRRKNSQSIKNVRLSFQSSERWGPPTPSPAKECCSPPSSKGGDTLACGEEDGGSQFRRRDKHSGTLCNTSTAKTETYLHCTVYNTVYTTVYRTVLYSICACVSFTNPATFLKHLVCSYLYTKHCVLSRLT